eukprot:GILK01003696.1.p1 GENE.GILK01003696.1~~GILK01003696.1.p1  ORF type:complete len:400 (-),score=52.47 GILK01003696.1:174-1283(-)
MADPAETTLCDNCQKQIPQANSLMHLATCKRNSWRCAQCNEVVRIGDKAAHEASHVAVLCDCGRSIEQQQLASHKANECSHRTSPCEFCHMPFKQSELASHEYYCGSRTELCPNCNKHVQLRAMAIHEATGCAEPASSSLSGSRSASPAYGAAYPTEAPPYMPTLTPQMSADPDHCSCESCGTVCDNYEELQVHMLTNCAHAPHNTATAATAATAAASTASSRTQQPVARSGSRSGSESSTDSQPSFWSRLTSRFTGAPESPASRQEVAAAERQFMDHIQTSSIPHNRFGALNPDESGQPDLIVTGSRAGPPSRTNQPAQPSGRTPAQVDPFAMTATAESDMLPCEICGEGFPLELLMDHQTVCAAEHQ